MAAAEETGPGDGTAGLVRCCDCAQMRVVPGTHGEEAMCRAEIKAHRPRGNIYRPNTGALASGLQKWRRCAEFEGI